MELKNDTLSLLIQQAVTGGGFLNMPEFPLLSDHWVSDFEV